MIFQNTPNTEAPREMNTYIPDLKALWMAENVTATLHNIYTLRGAPVRDPLNWSRYINEALYRFGTEAEVMFASHHWPRWGNARIREVLRDQRDLYANMNNQVLHYANQGVTINQIHNVYEMPAEPFRTEVALPRLSRFARAQQRAAWSSAISGSGTQPDDPDPAVAGGLRAALRRDDGRGRGDPRTGAHAPRRGGVSARDRDPRQARLRRARERRRRRTRSPTRSSSSATSRRTRGSGTASSPRPTSCARAFRRASP
jgi:hypothetical protein